LYFYLGFAKMDEIILLEALMNLDPILKVLEINLDRIQHLVEDISEEQACWRPNRDSWSILDVLVHLDFEECEDFRARLKITLRQDSDEQWPPIDPEAWVAEQRESECTRQEALDGFVMERQDSLEWLNSVISTQQAIDWDVEYMAPWGPMRAGDLLASWAGHDFLHMRQIVALQYAYTRDMAAPYQLKYAGDW
jgi:hypothetical protein